MQDTVISEKTFPGKVGATVVVRAEAQEGYEGLTIAPGRQSAVLVKEAANKEIYTEAEIVENSNVSADKLSDLVDNVKETVKEHHTEAHTQHMINRATGKIILSRYKSKTAY